MPARPKAFLKQAKPKNKKEQKLEDADDYQAAGVDFEDAAGKWRAGDPAKSVRFFQRALDVYEQGLHKFPQSLDLSYNKARVQLEIATHPLLVSHLQQPPLDALRIALESHRYALSLDQDNPDTLFNTAQLLTSIAEELAKHENHVDTEALQSLHEALELQTHCLNLQELKYEETAQQQESLREAALITTPGVVNEGDDENSDNEDGGASITTSKAAAQEDQWFSIVEPVTEDTLIDTVLAQLNTLTTLCAVVSSFGDLLPPATLAWVEEYSAKLLNSKLPYFLRNKADRGQEVALAKANFVSALLEAGYRTNTLDAETYKRERDAIFSVAELGLSSSIDALVSDGRSLISFHTALSDTGSDVALTASANVRWNALNSAVTKFTAASKLPNPPAEDLARTHLLRGDTSLLQYQMSRPPTNHATAVSNAMQLLKNAEVFYRNASKLSPNEDEKAVAMLRSGVTLYIQTGNNANIAKSTENKGEAWVKAQLEDMVLEGFIAQELAVQL